MALIINGKRQAGFPWGIAIVAVAIIGAAMWAWFSGLAKPERMKARQLAELAILDRMNDAKSFELISVVPAAFVGNGDGGVWLFEFNFRGKNMLGAMVRERRFMKADLEKNISWEISEREFYGMP